MEFPHAKANMHKCLLLALFVRHDAGSWLAWLQIVEGHAGAASDLHRWLERTAYHKVPRAHQEEAVEQLERPFDLVRPSSS